MPKLFPSSDPRSLPRGPLTAPDHDIFLGVVELPFLSQKLSSRMFIFQLKRTQSQISQAIGQITNKDDFLKICFRLPLGLSNSPSTEQTITPST